MTDIYWSVFQVLVASYGRTWTLLQSCNLKWQILF